MNPTTGKVQGIATYQATLPDGQNSIAAQYTADANYTGSSSAAITVNVAPDFTLSFDTASGNVMRINGSGSSGSLTLVVTGSTGYTGTVNFSANACKGLPLAAACHFNPASVTGSGSTMLTVTTTASHSASNRMAPGPRGLWIYAVGLCFAGVFLTGISPRKRRWSSFFVLLLFAWLLTTLGCGGSGGDGGGGGTPGTPPGTYVVTATGTDANFSHPVTFTLTVQ